MKIYIQNDEPCWVRYDLVVEVTPEQVHAAGFNPDNDREVHDYALQRVFDGEFDVFYGPEIKSSVESLDQQYEITAIERD